VTAPVPLTGERIRLTAGTDVIVGEPIGAGGEGVVYAVADTVEPDRTVIKWYNPDSASPQQWDALIDLIDRGPPHDRFVWPLDLVTRPDGDRRGGFGYVMDRIPDGFVSAADLVSGRIEVGLSQLARIGFELADSFLRLHAEGLCYRDINFGNVFVNAETGAICVCDNDHVGVDGTEASILGVRWFMAPEVIRLDRLPDRQTDLHSLAVLLFYLLVGGHPFDGRLAASYPDFDDRARTDLFGIRPRFVFDPVDDSNRPDVETQAVLYDMWALYPAFVKDRFVTTFVDGATDPDERVLESVWRKTMVRLDADICRCRTCGCEVFASGPATCWNCQSRVIRPPTLTVGDLEIMLDPDRVVRSYHLDFDYDLAGLFAEVNENPNRPGQWGLCNRSGKAWNADHPVAGARTVAPGRSIALDDGLRIRFGSATGVVHR
jgi:DNA-binding helix-hairpin-helix protein with protein kinase domain